MLKAARRRPPLLSALPLSRSLQSTVGLEWGQVGVMVVGASKVLEGDSGTPNRETWATTLGLWGLLPPLL